MSIYILYPLLNVVCFAIPLALFEISIEKAHGWGSGWSKDKWYAKSLLKGTKFGTWLSKVTKLEPPLNYHMILGYVIFPAVFIIEYVYGTRNIFLILSSVFFTLVAAELAWFSCNWYFDSWTQLTKGPKGSIFWHKDWVKIGKDKYLPKTYFTWTATAIILLVIAVYVR